MAKIKWDATGERAYETGVSKAVLYVMNQNNVYDTGVPWNGITAVTESPSGAELNDLYADDIKYASLRSAETFGATIEAYTYPDEFGVCDGSVEPVTGVSIGQQSRKPFGFTYVTKIGNDTMNEAEAGYKIHIIYNATASPSEKQYQTINDSPEAISFSWTLTTTPVNVSGYKPTSILTVKSTDFKTTEEKARLKALEDVLYGTANSEPRLPLPDEVIAMMNPSGETVTLTFNANGHGTAPEAETVTKGTAATAPTDPVAEGYTFGGWYEEAACTNAFSFATVLNADKIVYAKWTESEG